jgi:hypothetical protein
VALNHEFWGRYFRRIFVPQTDMLIETLLGRLLPTFANAEEEAEMKSDEEWSRLCALPALEDDDESDVADQAMEAGVAHYQMMMGLEQGLKNMFAAALYHLYEQQVMLFHRRELLRPSERDHGKLLNHCVFRDRLIRSQCAVDITRFSCWRSLEELHLLANVVKHGEGESATRLRASRPELFVRPALKDLQTGRVPSLARVFTPLMGEDVYVAVEHLRSYAEAVRHFWDELYEAMAKA